MARIRLSGVTKRYGSATALHRLDLDIADREFIVFLGPSGCGKTTTLNIVAGLEDISEGEIYFDEKPVTDVPPHQREIAMVFQSYALYPQKTVYENVAFGLRLRNHASDDIDRRVRAAAEKLEIGHLLDRRPAQLSGGQRQRVALGRALVREPSAFLMDEPLSNLDAALRVSMRTLIKKLHAEMRTTFVYVTHDQAEAMTLADRIMVMRDGRVQQLGTPDEIYNRPANRFVAAFLGNPQMNFVEGEIEAAPTGARFRCGEFALEVPPALARAIGRKVVLGVRAEDFGIGGDAGAGTIDAAVSLVLPLGSEQHLDIVCDAVELTVRAPKEIRAVPGDAIRLQVRPERLHLFDAQTEASLLAEAR
jgi:multiple sugar transport system ATP-binding protein